jgi:hypothetical protein
LDAARLAGWLLVVGPVLGLVGVAQPVLIRIWSMPREEFIAAVTAHRRAWTWLNTGFGVATLATTSGMVVLAVAIPGRNGSAALAGCALTYAVGGALWLAVLAIRTRTTPLLGDLDGDARTGPSATLLEAATTGLFQAFVLITGGTLAALGVSLMLVASVPVGLGAVITLAGVLCVGWLITTGDVIPAVLYLPTILLGVYVLVWWGV